MNFKITSLFLIALCVLTLFSCKKEKTDLIIRYEITTSIPIATTHPALGNLNSFVTYAKDEVGAEETEARISGNTWIKEITVKRPTKNTGFVLGGNFYLSNSTGSVTAKIYVDNKLETEHKEDASALPVANLSLVSIGTYYQFVYN